MTIREFNNTCEQHIANWPNLKVVKDHVVGVSLRGSYFNGKLEPNKVIHPWSPSKSTEIQTRSTVTSLCDNFDVVNKLFLPSYLSKQTHVMSGFVVFMCYKLHYVFFI